MKRCKLFLFCLIYAMFGSCSVSPEQTELPLSYSNLKPCYMGPGHLEVKLLDEPMLCKGLAGEISGVGCKIAVVPIMFKDDNGNERIVLGLVSTTEELKKDQKISGHLIFVSNKVRKNGKGYLP